MSLDLDRLHTALHVWQPRWLQRLFYPLLEAGSALILLPLLLGLVWGLRLWWPVPYVAAPIVLIIASAVYEKVMSGPKWTDHLWRTVGTLWVWWWWVLLHGA